MRLIAGWCVSCLLLSCLAACAPNQEPMERAVNRMLTEVVGPAVTKAIAETTTQTAALTGGAQAIEPGYLIEFEGWFGTGIRGSAVVKITGISGQLTGAIQAEGKHDVAGPAVP